MPQDNPLKEMEIPINSIAELPEAARKVLAAIGDRKVVAFDAPMGAGKTTLIGEMCRQLGVDDDTSSPTFAIINDYHPADGGHIYHFDCYRIEDPREAVDMGVEEYFYSGYPCFIEWPDRIEEFLPADTLRVTIRLNPDGSRSVVV